MNTLHLIDSTALLCILAMAGVTYLARITGLLLLRFVKIEGRLEAALQAVPPAILMAVITPVAIATGPAETLATGITALAATRLPLLAAIATGVISVVILRLFMV
ncbi:AzlD family protein [Polycladidibacter stylochi]|uniref:AzlD family protein n=1 Tax=Polycladidibacter stylochi TaxID=1807766 RepID=UPI00082DB68D|nr:AzlD domain-containing protein [Pseudovibrio stylochi]